MKVFYTLLIVGLATALLMAAGHLTKSIPLKIHPNILLNNMLKYQLFTLLVAVLVTIAILILNPVSRDFLSIGQLNIMAEKENWLGINGQSSWQTNGFQLLFVVSIATSIFMFLGVKQTDNLNNFQWSFIPLVLLFALTNSLAEELIFRFGIVGGLYEYYPKLIILIISAVLFGLPHYFGVPSGLVGVLMSAVLGYILCKATIETNGLLVAWVIHFIQDVIIFTGLMMMNVNK